MITQEFAEEFARKWVDAWNSHDIDAVLSHYSDDFEMSSPYIIQITGDSSGTLRGKKAVEDYWRKALEKLPTLRFELQKTLVGVESLVLYYRGVRGMAAEVFFFDRSGHVFKAFAHYE